MIEETQEQMNKRKHPQPEQETDAQRKKAKNTPPETSGRSGIKQIKKNVRREGRRR